MTARRRSLVPLLLVLTNAACDTVSSNGGGQVPSGSCSPGNGNSLNPTCTPSFTQSTPNAPGSIEVTFSGETLGVAGLPFIPVNVGDPYFVDGWDVSFEEILVVLGNFRVAPGATQTLAQNQVNAPVATMAGPFVVDMHNPQGFVGKDGVEPAGAIFKWDNQDNGQSFDVNTRYSFSYDVVQAVYPATQINLSSAQFADYDLMVKNGWSKLYRGVATYVGGTCNNPTIQAQFASFPTSVYFMFGWNDATWTATSPSGSFSMSALNCANPDFGEDNVPANRGVQPTNSGAVIAQVTLHVDHAFWDILKQEGAPLRFDPIAAWAPANTSAASPFDVRTLANKPFAPATFSNGTPLADRSACITQPVQPYTSDQPTGQVTLNLNGVPPANIAGIAAFMAFSAQSQMHMNANGLCYIVGQQASDPYYVPNI